MFKDTLYHGSSTPSIKRLLPDARSGEYGIYLTPRFKMARAYGDNVYRVLVNIQNPFFVTDKSEIAPRGVTRAIARRLSSEGYDAIVSSPTGEIADADEVVVFDPSSVHVLRTNPEPDEDEDLDDEPVLYFHTTSFANVSAIVEDGEMVPRRGRGVFNHGGYDLHSQGKLFLAPDQDSALSWYNKIDTMLEHNASDMEEPEYVVPVVLRITLPDDAEVFEDEIREDISNSVYVKSAVPIENIEFYDPVKKAWAALDDDTWLEQDPMNGVKRVEAYNDDGDEVSPRDPDVTSIGYTTFSAHSDGGFKPPYREDWNEP